ncbi:ClC family H(+)/Cl(-) exchange transporter [Variovorax ginsengisoli]|uniref:ClC family H(+)/Cl(-) exchange transporter n=1 Tax=Variovorax ginsengisoli TaxID=363844 RepID=A0ABT8S2Y7_9BURK|nr:ClC family H(+)/Cl(-) exchange transporter [Variovorax ginsengisoli]MDN8613693.1 ClC family H(+)/Cl(-) exchange transporter [Variovorax ginsengisoli]MDO1532863.1 ClC family H(+)/Cl(-) exchange transporter [Variovorax ginsengisoli]
MAPDLDQDDSRAGTLVLALLSLLVGCATGLVCAVFRLLLQGADALRGEYIAWAHQEGLTGLLLVVASAAAATAFAAALVSRISPNAAGSGIPEVEAAINGGEPGRPVRTAIVKFVGGVLAIGSGLALGREGPSVQMGHSIADLIGRLFRRGRVDARVLFAAGAGAGLATAFNAPIAGAVFVLEELLRRFDTRTAAAALGASAGAIAVARVFVGVEPDFAVPAQAFPGFATVPVHVALGVIAALVAAAYTRAVMGALAIADQADGIPVAARAALVGGGVGLLGWLAPAWVGGGDALTQQALLNAGSLSAIGLIFAFRFAFGPLCYAAGTPGGLFAPMLVLGAQIGLVFGRLYGQWFPDSASPTAYAVVGLAAFFTAVVRAPLTGICLAVEMTGSVNLLLPMLAACFGAMVMMNLLGIPPIYDLLRERAERKLRTSG